MMPLVQPCCDIEIIDPGYMLINWVLRSNPDGRFIALDMISGTVLSLGVTYYFCGLPRPGFTPRRPFLFDCWPDWV